MTPPDTPSLVERLRDANAGIEILEALEDAPHCKADLAKAERAIRDAIAHIEAQAAQIAALQSTNAHLHEGLAANAREMAEMVEEVKRLRFLVAEMVRSIDRRVVGTNFLHYDPNVQVCGASEWAAQARKVLPET